MSGGIFLIQSGGDLVEMKEQPYDTEAVLQELLARYPNLLAGDQTSLSVEMKKGGVACIEMGRHLHAGAGTLLWLAPPKILRSI